MTPPPAYRRLRDAYIRGDADGVIGQAQALIDQLDGDPEHGDLVAPVLTMVGATLASQEHYADGLAYLERGLSMASGDTAQHEMGKGDTFAMVELDLLLLVGRYRDVWTIVQRLAEPDRPIESRLGAARAHIALATVFGDFDTAHNLLNTASGLAHQLRSRQQEVVVDGDRAIVAASRGRVVEAAAFADEVLPLLARPGPGARLAWARAQAVTVATSVARAAAEAGDAGTAERLLASIGAIADQTGRSFDRAQVDLARGTVWRAGGHLAEAEAPISSARRVFLSLGCAPAAAMAQLEEARLAVARGYQSSSRPLLERARAEFDALGLPREVASIDALLASGTATSSDA